jgi:toxin ParE1/3/4
VTAYRFTEKAAEDLVGIWIYTDEKWGEEQADRYQDEIFVCCERVANGAVGTSPVPGMTGISSFRCSHHYLFFVKDGQTTILSPCFMSAWNLWSVFATGFDNSVRSQP